MKSLANMETLEEMWDAGSSPGFSLGRLSVGWMIPSHIGEGESSLILLPVSYRSNTDTPQNYV